MPTLCLKDQLIGDETIYLELVLTVRMVRWNKLPGYWQLKDKKNSPLTINNYWNNGVTIYIYIYIYIVMLYLRERKLRYFADLVFQCYSESETFAEESLVLGEIFYSYSPVFGMDIKYLMSCDPKTPIFIVYSPGKKHYWSSQPTPCRWVSLFTLTKTKIKDLINLSKDLTF